MITVARALVLLAAALVLLAYGVAAFLDHAFSQIVVVGGR